MAEPREIEVKLELDPSCLPGLRKRLVAALGVEPGPTREIRSVYFDTAKRTLHRRGLALRVRHEGGRRVQTLKAEDRPGTGLFDRAEWEAEIGGEVPEAALFADERARRLLDLKGALAPAFETRFARAVWSVEAGASRVEVTLDDGTVTARGRSDRLLEIECELKSGDPADLFDLVRRVAALPGLRLGATSKSERGYGLLASRDKSAAAKAEPVALAREMDAAAAFQAIARSCLRQFLLNEALLLESRSADALHQARVGMRRLRSALSLFREVVADGEVEALRRELRAVSTLLGVARNLDVYRARVVEGEILRDVAEPGLAAFAARIEQDRGLAYDRVVRKLGSRRFRLFVLDLSRWIEAGPWQAVDHGPGRQKAWAFAGRLLEKRRRAVKRSGRDLDRLDPDERHEVRIRAKKLRYASEFFAALVRGRKRRHRHALFVRSLEGLQACLGELNDIQTGHDVARSLAAASGAAAGDEASQVSFAAGHAAGRQDDREPALLAAAVDAYGAFAAAKPFWR